MKYLVTLWKSERGYCPCEETVILLHFDPERKPTHIGDTFWGQVKHVWRVWRQS
jgi:hypothetical protein